MKKKGKGLAFLFITLICIFIGSICISASQQVFAAEESIPVTYVQDESGAYLQKIDGAWYYYDKEKKPLSGMQYIHVSPDPELGTGFYMTAPDGKLILEQAMYKLKEQNVKGVIFEGYYISNSKGCFEKEAAGLQYISKVKYNDGYKTMDYIVFMDSYGSLTRSGAGLRYIPTTTINGVTYKAGYYHFSTNGRMYTDSVIRFVKEQTVDGKKIGKGYYFFGENGRMESSVLYTKSKGEVYLQKIGKAWYCFDKEKKPLSGMQYISKSPEKGITAGFYMTASDGRLILEQALYKLKKQEVNGVVFEGYYISNGKGRFVKSPIGLRYISKIKYNNGYKTMNYIVYIDAYGSLTRSGSGLRYIPTTTVNKVTYKAGYYHFSTNGRLYTNSLIRSVKKQIVDGKTIQKGYYYFAENGRMETGTALRYVKQCVAGGVTFKTGYYILKNGCIYTKSGPCYMSAYKANNVSFTKGYYYFETNGRLSTTKQFRTIHKKVASVTYDGTYYFGNANARMRRTAGWITFNGEKYYIDKTGKRLENCWHEGYYLQADGTIAKNKQVPDGSWVDWQGKKCSKEEVGLGELKNRVKNITAKYSGSWSVYVKNLETGDIINLNEKAMYPASTIKAFVMASTFEQIKNKKISYNSTIKSYLKSMITVSDNEAYNQLVKRQTTSLNFNTGFSVVNQYLKANGYKNTECHTTLSPSYTGYRSDGKGSNKASAKDCGVLLEKIYKGTCVSKEYSKEMLNLLLGQQRTWKIPAGIPSGVKVANKTGETSTVQHDMAIVYGPKTDYVICVFASGVSEYYGIKGIKEISKATYDFLN